MKKLITLFMALMMLMSMLTGCSSGKKSEPAPDAGGAADAQSEQTPEEGGEKTKIKFATTSSYVFEGEGMAFLESIKAAFEKTHPDIEVEIVVITCDGWSDYFTKLQTMIAAGDAPDVFYTAIEGTEICRSLEINRPLNAYIEADGADAWADYCENTGAAFRNAGEKDGDVYGVAVLWQNIITMINKDLLAEADLPVPDPNWDFDTFVEYCDKLSFEREDGSRQYAFAAPTGYFPYTQWLYHFGTGYLNRDLTEITFDSPESVELMQFMADAVNRYKYAPLGDAGYDSTMEFINGNLAMVFCGSWGLNSANSNEFTNYEVVNVPTKYDDQKMFAVGYIDVASASKNYEAACEFALWCGSKEHIEMFCGRTGDIPVREDAAAELKERFGFLENIDLFITTPEDAIPMQNPPAYAEISNILDRYLAACLAGEIDAEKACNDAAEEMRAAYRANPTQE